jgi:hypothetical protein
MACQKCIDQGKQKIIHFARCGRWDTRIYCKHTYTRGKLSENETHHVLSRHEVDPIKKGSREAPEFKRVKHSYTEAEDKFILANYTDCRHRSPHRGMYRMQKMLDEYNRVFGRRPTPNQMVGRYNRLIRMELEKAEQIRGTPSLPVLSFMRGENA